MSKLALALLVLAFACPIALRGQATPPDHKEAAPAGGAPSAEQVKATVEELKTAFKSDKPEECIAAIEKAEGVDAKEVVTEMAKGLRDKDDAVRIATMKAFGRMSSAESLAELNRLAKNVDAKLEKNSPVLAALYRAIGQRGDPSSVTVLTLDMPGNTDAEVLKARIYGLGNIRARESVEALIKGMNLANPLPGEDSPFMPDIRVALARLTGTDQTTNKSRWQEWWNKNKKDFKISATPPELARDLQQAWDDYWGSDLRQPERTGHTDGAAPAREGGGERGGDGMGGENGAGGDKPRGG